MRHGRVAIAFLLVALLALPASASAAGFGSPGPYQDTRIPSQQPTTVSAFELSSPARVRIVRSFADGRPPITADVATPRDPRAIHVAHNAARDALVVWTETAGSPQVTAAKTVFWPAAASAPGPAHEVLVTEGGGGLAFGALDAARSATVLFNVSKDMWQATSPDVTAADPWPQDATVLATGEPHVSSGGAAAGTPDGRAVFAFKPFVPTGGSPPGWFPLFASTRMPGQPFRPMVQIDGAAPPGRTVGAEQPAVAVAPGGRAMVAYGTSSATTTCETPPGDARVHVALGTIANAPPSFTTTQVSAADRDAGQIRAPFGGADDRLAVGWRELANGPCTSDRPARMNFAYTVPGQGVSVTGPPPGIFNDVWWQCDGQLAFITQPSQSAAAERTVFDTGVPGTCGTPPEEPEEPSKPGPPAKPGGPGEPGGGGKPGGGGEPGGGDPPGGGVIEVPTITTGFRPSSRGTVRLTVVAPGPGSLVVDLHVRRSGLLRSRAVAAAAKKVRVRRYRRTVAQAGPVRLTLKLKGKARRALGRRRKLKVTVRTTFRPAGGGQKVVRSRTVTFRLKR